jgi:sulfur relay protein TusB/DsrH
MTLHTLNKSGNSELVRLCIAALDSHDCLLLIEDGVFIALDMKNNVALLSDLPQTINLYVLSEDLAARGISAKIRSVFTSITYVDFVRLSLEKDKVINWN